MRPLSENSYPSTHQDLMHVEGVRDAIHSLGLRRSELDPLEIILLKDMHAQLTTATKQPTS